MSTDALRKKFSKLALLSCYFTAFLSTTSIFAAADFQNLDESDASNNLEDLQDDAQFALPEIEAEQSDLRQERQNSLGLAMGALMPYVTVLIEYRRNFDISNGAFVALGRGSFKSTSQESGELLVSTKLKTSAIDLGYLWWPSNNFPISVAGLLGAIKSDGEVYSVESAPQGRYGFLSIGIGADMRVESVFENGIFLKWVLLSMRQMKVLSEQHSQVSSAKLASTRDRFSGLKILGITNLTLGYAW